MLSCYNNTCCRWRALYWDSSKRPESEGSPVPPHSKILINHSASNRNLAVEPGIWFPTFFGMVTNIAECDNHLHPQQPGTALETALLLLKHLRWDVGYLSCYAHLQPLVFNLQHVLEYILQWEDIQQAPI
ncbi:uncharacterized protein LOC126263502 [Schistocerca nitens]|uniref:uncharacterized protein LOC126263502 n=1 Tax=Schistocerca nitens TaxID=7011 RepID=UPI0021183FA6|nr:uncharacterized protein LOC126263502 [Schistocerca nitens]